MAVQQKKKAQTRTLDMTNVKERSGVNPVRQQEGDYLGRVESVEEVKSKGGDDMWLYIISTPEDNTRAAYPYYCKFDEGQLFKIRNLFVAAGIRVPKKKMAIDPNKVVGKEIGMYLQDGDYEGREKSEIDQVFPKEDLPETATMSRDDDDEEEVEDDDDLDLGDDDEELTEDEEDEPEEEDEEDEEDEEPEPPKKKAAARKSSTKKATAKKRKKPVDDDEDLDELDIEDM